MKPDFSEILLTETPDATIITSLDGAVVYWNKGAEGLFGYPAEDAVGRLLDDLVVPHDRRGERQKALNEAIENGFSTFESIRHCQDGSLVYVVVSSKVVLDAAGRPEYVISTKVDVTHLKVLRDAKLVEAQFRDLLESTPDAIIMTNQTGRVVLANSQAETLFGYDHGEMLGQPVEALLPARYRGNHVGYRTSYYDQPRTRAMGAGLELFGLCKDGREIPVEISLSPLQTEEGTLVMSAIRDVTDRKEIERALHQKNIELINAAAAKNRFLANMSHELRTPLNGVIGFAEFLSDEKPGPLNAKQKEYLQDILNSGRHLLTLINDVLDLAKVEAGKMELSIERFSLARAIEEVCAVANPLAKKKSIYVQTRVHPDLEDVFLDPQKTKQILYNLLSNAIKFSDDGSEVRVEAVGVGEDELRISVIDSGIGIRPEDQVRLFTEFEQLESGTSRRYEGTGLGLALTRRIVELQGGSIHVESEMGTGSTFHVTLPRVAKGYMA